MLMYNLLGLLPYIQVDVLLLLLLLIKIFASHDDFFFFLKVLMLGNLRISFNH